MCLVQSIHHGLSGPPLWNVATATLLSRLLYASPVWWDMVDAGGKQRLQAVLNKAVKQGFLPKAQASLELHRDSADMELIIIIIMNFYSPVFNSECHSIGHKMRRAKIKIRVDSPGRWERA